MAGWYHVQELGPAQKLLGTLRRAESKPLAPAPEPVEGLREEHVSLVAAYIGAYPDDADDRIRCNDDLRTPARAPSF